MKNNIIDSSAWIEYFKGNREFLFITDLIYTNSICINDIILTELLPSIILKNEHHLADIINTIKKYDLIIDWEEIRRFQLLNIKKGNNNIGISDLIIVQNCIQNNLKLIHYDKHFTTMSKYIKFEIYQR
ncbi:MAG: PIN domain-containing protein [Spirochaetales bacterium]|nr:PIN domain-containing protein [Spirochaetales bacterium]